MWSVAEYRLGTLGNAGVGKSALEIRLVQNIFVEQYDPTIESGYRKQVNVDDETAILEIAEMGAWEEFAALREQCIRSGQGWLAIYSVTSRASFEALEGHIAEIARVKEQPAEDLAIVIVGNKIDLREEALVTEEEGRALADKYDYPFYETSAKAAINVEEAFYQLIREIRKKSVDSSTLEREFREWWKKDANLWDKINFNVFSGKQAKKKKKEQIKEALMVEKKKKREEEKKQKALSEWEAAKNDVPRVPIEASTFNDDMRQLVDDAAFSDVVFELRDGELRAHLAILLSHFSGIFETLKKEEETTENRGSHRNANVSSDVWERFLANSGLSNERMREISAIFACNGLSPDSDSGDFDHDLLKSMDITIAKERLLILKHVQKKTGKRNEEEEEEEDESPKGTNRGKTATTKRTITRYRVDGEVAIFKKIVEFIYCGRLLGANSPETVGQISNLAKKLRVYPVIAICAALLEGKEPPYDGFSMLGQTDILFDADVLSDIQFTVEGQTVHAHKAVLASRAQYFRRMFLSGMAESRASAIDLSRTSVAAFKALLKYMYTDKDDLITADTVMEVFYLAHMYEIQRLASICQARMAEWLDAQNVLELWRFAQQFDAIGLLMRCEHFVRYRLPQVKDGADYRRLLNEEERARFESMWMPQPDG